MGVWGGAREASFCLIMGILEGVTIGDHEWVLTGEEWEDGADPGVG
jgi:hypothetical protein